MSYASNHNSNRLLGLSASFTALFLLVCSGPAAAALQATPDVLVFHNTTQSESVELRMGDQTLSGSAVSSWQLLVDHRNYSHMLHITPTETGLRVSPSETVEIGSYILALRTPHGETHIQVFTPLSEHESVIESLARRMNVSLDEARRQMGISQRLSREQVSLNARPVYYWGQRLTIEMPTPEHRSAIWKINGETVSQDENKQRFEYPLLETGPVLIAYEEWESGILVASASALSEVVKQPAVDYQAAANATVRFHGPEGFSRYSWQVDGASAGNTALFERRFNAPGRHTVTVLCEGPLTPGPYHAREITYQVTVAAP